MEPLNLPSYEPKVQLSDGKATIFCPLRHRFVALTPEEWVRQHFVNFLVHHMGYPSSLMANEVGITLNGTSKRCDTILYDRTMAPRMIIEYKAPHIKLTPKVFQQISRYNLVLRVDYLMVSNGRQHYCLKMDYAQQTYQFLQNIPRYDQL